MELGSSSLNKPWTNWLSSVQLTLPTAISAGGVLGVTSRQSIHLESCLAPAEAGSFGCSDPATEPVTSHRISSSQLHNGFSPNTEETTLVLCSFRLMKAGIKAHILRKQLQYASLLSPWALQLRLFFFRFLLTLWLSANSWIWDLLSQGRAPMSYTFYYSHLQ